MALKLILWTSTNSISFYFDLHFDLFFDRRTSSRSPIIILSVSTVRNKSKKMDEEGELESSVQGGSGCLTSL